MHSWNRNFRAHKVCDDAKNVSSGDAPPRITWGDSLDSRQIRRFEAFGPAFCAKNFHMLNGAFLRGLE
jgi:hypothetical protein